MVNTGALPASGTTSTPASETNPPPGPDRFSIITVDYISYEWDLVNWKDRAEVCSIIIDHDGMPLPEEVYRDCGTIIYSNWMSQPLCNLNNAANCEGYFAGLSTTRPKQKEIAMQLPAASAWITLEDCEPVFSTSTNICETKPTLVISGREPLPNETILRVEGTYNGQPFSCADTDVCKFRVPETENEGVTVEFWAYSSYGDSSPVYEAQCLRQKSGRRRPRPALLVCGCAFFTMAGKRICNLRRRMGRLSACSCAPAWLSTPTKAKTSAAIFLTHILQRISSCKA